jgi:hypothetical protein
MKHDTKNEAPPETDGAFRSKNKTFFFSTDQKTLQKKLSVDHAAHPVYIHG